MNQKDIKKIARKNGVKYHHHDQFEKPRYHDDEDLKNSVVVIYSSQYGHWQLAINKDGSLSRPGQNLSDRLRNTAEKAQELINERNE